VDSRGRHTRSTPQLPPPTLESDPEKIIKRGKALREGASTVEPGISDSSHCSMLETPISASQFLVKPLVGVSHLLNFGSVHVEFSPPGLGLDGERFVTPISPDVAACSRPRNSEDFPNPGFTVPSPITVATIVPTPTSIPLIPVAFSSNLVLIHFPPASSFLVSLGQTPSPPSSPPPNIHMAGVHPPINRMDSIEAVRYAPLILPHPMNHLPARDYLNYMPKFTSEEDIIAEEHLVAFYSYEDNLNIENEDVWMRLFVQSLYGEVRKWFRGLTPGSIVGI
jgi:hypothetical protein